MKIIIIIGLIYIAAVGVMIYFINEAPSGYEDENGFHYDNPKDKL